MHTGKKPKILVAISNIAIGGGAEKVAVELAKKLQDDQHEVVLLTFYSAEKEHHFSGTRVSRKESTPASLLGKLPRAIARIFFIRRICREHNIDSCVSFLEESNYYCLLSKVLLGNKVPMIVSVRLDPRFYNGLYKFFIRHLYPKAQKVVAVTKYVEKVLQKEFSLTNTTTIYNPIDRAYIHERSQESLPEAWQHLEQEDHVVISIGRLTKQKGQWHAIRAFSAVIQKVPTARLVLLGDGEYRDKLEKLIGDCGLKNSVHLAGKQENVYAFLATAELFIFTSLWEGMPNTVLEALACELPIVAADCASGPREIIAPELGIDSEIMYPYDASYGTLLAPFDTVSEPIWDAPSVIPLSSAERGFADAIIASLQEHRENKMSDGDQRFDPLSIRKQWQTLVDSEI